MRVDFTLTGITAILFHADDVEASDRLQAWRNDPDNKNRSVRGDDRSPPWTWICYLYSDGTNLAWPSYNLSVGLRKAGAQIVIPGQRNKTFKEVSVNGMAPTTEFLEFSTGGKPIPFNAIMKLERDDKPFADHVEWAKANGFRLWAKRAPIGQAKHVRVRARFDKWQMKGSMLITQPEVLTFDRVKQIFEIAGRGGQGDWRPACKTPGPFGQFTAELKIGK